MVWADTAGRWPTYDEDTADFGYVRLHGHTELYAGGYDDQRLEEWAERVHGWSHERDVYVYFDNDAEGRATYDAVELRRRVALLRHLCG